MADIITFNYTKIHETWEEPELFEMLKYQKNECKQFLLNKKKRKFEYLYFLMNLHLILEISCNMFFRYITLYCLGSPYPLDPLSKCKNKGTVADDIDDVSFLHKMSIFMYWSKPYFLFDKTIYELFEKPREELTQEEFDLIWNNEKQDALDHKGRIFIEDMLHEIKLFSKARNSIVHGHAKMLNLANQDYIESQIKRFKKIMDGVAYFLDQSISIELKSEERTAIKLKFLDSNFLNL